MVNFQSFYIFYFYIKSHLYDLYFICKINFFFRKNSFVHFFKISQVYLYD